MDIVYFYENIFTLRKKCPNTDFFLVRIFPFLDIFLRIQSKNGKIRTIKNSVNGHFSRSVILRKSLFPSFPLSLLTLQVFFEIFLPQPPVMLSIDLHWSITCSFTKKACKFAIKRDSSRKKCQTQNAERKTP